MRLSNYKLCMVLLAVGCNQDVIYPPGERVVVDIQKMPPQLYPCVMAGLRVWDAVDGDFVYDEGPTLVGTPRLSITFKSTPGAAGLYNMDGTLFLDPDELEQNEAFCTSVTAHELGHALGLDHVQDPACQAIMAPCTDFGVTVTEIDLHEFERVHGKHYRRFYHLPFEIN